MGIGGVLGENAEVLVWETGLLAGGGVLIQGCWGDDTQLFGGTEGGLGGLEGGGWTEHGPGVLGG